MRQLVVTFLVATMLAACGGSPATPTPAPITAPTAVPTVALTASPSPTAPPTAATAGPSGSGAFVVAGLVSTLDVNGGLPDSSTFGTSFASDTPAIYVPYQLAPGLAGKVTSTWTSVGGSNPVVISFDYPASAPWAYVRLTRPGGFISAAYQEVLIFEPTGASVTLPFTITGPQASAATPAPSSSGTSAFTFLRMATTSVTSKAQADKATYTDSYPTTAAAVFVVFTLRSGLTGTVTLTMTHNGAAIIQPLPLDVSVANGWNDFHIDSSSGFPVGDYAATVTFAPTGEAQTVTFTVK